MARMNNGNEVLAAVLSLHRATEQNFNRLEATMDQRFDAVDRRFGAVEGRIESPERSFNRFEVKVLARFDAIDQRFDKLDALLISVESR